MTMGRKTMLGLLALPLLVYLLFLVLPLFSMGQLSLRGYQQSTGIQNNVTLEQYRSIAGQAYYLNAWLETVRVCSLATLIAVALGAVVAYFLWKLGGRPRAYLTAILLAPLLVSGVVRAYGWIAVMGPNGMLASTGDMLGLGKPAIMFNEAAVIIGLVNVFLPYVVIMTLVCLDGISASVLKAAANLGASSWQIVWRVLLPLAYRTLVSAFLLVFALASASYSIPAVLGGGKTLTISQVIYIEQSGTLNWPRAAALGLALAVLTLVVMIAYQFLAGRLGRARPAAGV